MARIRSILTALATIEWRDVRSVNSISSNNFFLFCMLLMMQPASMVFLGTVGGLLLFFPLSADPMKKIPAERLPLFPLAHIEHIALRAAASFLSPAIWLILAILLIGGARFQILSLQLLVLAVGANAIAFWAERFLQRAPRFRLLLYIPSFPGITGGLIRKNLRELLHVLDLYLACALCAAGIAYRLLSPTHDPDAVFMITLLIVLALSTYAQQQFALDIERGLVRYRLMPLKGWRILLAKDIAFLTVLIPLVLPLAPLTGIAAGLAALAFGHQPSVMQAQPQARWRFVAGVSVTHALLQTVLMFGLGSLTFRQSPLFAAVSAGLWLASLFAFGWQYDRSRY
ncbi:MAG: hypothetical protein JST93_34455 [Acidobacteria bacterium]|nr:hypothetical protein [Acidobacteriota bacterium]